MSVDNQNPVWAVYDEYRTARLNVYYYQYQISKLRRYNILLDIVIALSTSSVIAGLWFWETSIGNVSWKVIGALAAILVVIKPIINISDLIKQKSELFSSWQLLSDGFKKLTILISEQNQYNDEMKKRFHELLDMESDINQKETPEEPDKKLQRRYFEQVNREIPPESLIEPEEN